MADLLSRLRGGGSDMSRPSSRRNDERYMAYFAASDPVTISASHDERATEVCFFDEQLTVAEPMWKVNPEVECLTAQPESLYPSSAFFEAS